MLYIHTNMQTKLIHKIKNKKKKSGEYTQIEKGLTQEKKKSLFLSCYDELVVRKPGRDARNLKRGSRSGAGGYNGDGAWCFYAELQPCEGTFCFSSAGRKSDSWRSG